MHLFLSFLAGFLFVITPVTNYNTTPVIVIAHRGDHSSAPENTLKAFEDAIANGADYIEVDLRTTADGELVVMHDATVDRTTNGKGAIKDMTLTQLRALRIVSADKSFSGIYQVPTFEQVLDMARNRIKIYLDFKEADALKTWQLIQKYKMDNDIVVYINKNDQYPAWRTNGKHIPLMVSLPDSVTDVTALQRYLQVVDADILDGSTSTYTPEMIRIAHAAGRKIWVDVQSDTEGKKEWMHALNLGVDGLQTDHLPELKAWLKSQP